MSDLFQWAETQPRYPDAPGYQRTDTSRDAAKAMESKSGRLQRLVLAAIRSAGDLGMHMEEAAEAVGEGRHSIQPRCSELRAKGLVRDGGVRRPLASGKLGICWIAVEGETN